MLDDETTLRLLENKGADITKIDENTCRIYICGDDIRVESRPAGESEDTDRPEITVRVFETGNSDNVIDKSVFAVPYVTYDAEGQTLKTSMAVREADRE